MARVRCPHCLAAIDAEADVCRHCGRDVRKLLDVLAEVKELKSKNPAGSPRPAGRGPRFNAALLAFYSATTLLIWYGIDRNAAESVDLLLLALPVIAGAALTLISKSYSVGLFFMLGFVQPVSSYLFLILVGFLEINDVTPLLRSMFTDALRVGAVVALGGLAAAYASKALSTQSISLSWLTSPTSELERWEEIVIRVAAIATPLITLWSWFAGSPK